MDDPAKDQGTIAQGARAGSDSRRKALDRTIALLVFGIAMLMPPLVGISLVNISILGMPLPLLYVTVIWVILIVGTAALSRTLRDADGTAPPASSADTDT